MIFLTLRIAQGVDDVFVTLILKTVSENKQHSLARCRLVCHSSSTNKGKSHVTASKHESLLGSA